MATLDPATDLAVHLDTIARTKGAPAAVAMAESMICAATTILIRERGGRYAYGTLQNLADDVALQIIARRVDHSAEE